MKKLAEELRGDSTVAPAIQITLLLEVRDMALPATPSLPVLCGLSEEVFEKRWRVRRPPSASALLTELESQWAGSAWPCDEGGIYSVACPASVTGVVVRVRAYPM